MKTIGDIVTTDRVVRLPEGATALEAAQAMVAAHVGAILVTGPDGAASGMFTERDLMVRVIVSGDDPAGVTIGRKMSAELYTASLEDGVNAVAEEMSRRHIRHLPVVEDGDVVAMLSFRDLLRAHLTEVEDAAQAMTDYIQGSS